MGDVLYHSDHFSLQVSSEPAVEPVSTAEAKAHMRVDVSDDDTLIDAYIKAARIRLEEDTGRALITQTLVVKLDDFPLYENTALLLPRPPLQSVTSITYIDEDGVQQTWDSSKYIVDTGSEPARITPAYDEVWPSARDQINAVTITYVAGYGDAATDVPSDLIQAVKMLAAHWYEHREEVAIGVSVSSVPMAYKRLMQSRKTWL